MKIGDRVMWHRHNDSVLVTITKIGKKRMSIRTDGGYSTTANPANLEPTQTAAELVRDLCVNLAR